MIVLILIYLCTGLVSGFLAGFFGIGGGIIVVPMLHDVFLYLNFPSQEIMHLAIGTSFSIMMFATISAVRSYHQRDLIDWSLFYKFTPGLLLGVLLGTYIGRYLSSYWLQIMFAVFLLGIAFKIGYATKAKRQKQSLPHPYAFNGVAVGTGILSGFFGIGGGSMIVPYFVSCHLSMYRATATSCVCGFMVAVFGTISMMATGWSISSLSGLPWGVTGFVYWPATLCMVITSVTGASLGAKIAIGLPEERLKRWFMVLLVVIAVDLLLH